MLVHQAADLLEIGDAASAERLSREALRLAPDCAEAFSNLSYALLLQDQLDEAERAAKKGIEIQPLLLAAWHNLAEVHLKRKDPVGALQHANRALVIDPNAPTAWLRRGNALMMADQFVEAQACFERALSLDSTLDAARLNRDVAYIMMDPSRHSVLKILIGLASELESRRMDQQDASAYVVSLRIQPGVDASLVAALDSFARINLRQDRGLAVHLCWLNHILALDVGDPDLVDATRRTAEVAAA